MYSLIAGYNTLPKEEQEKYDIEKIATLFKNVFFGMAFILILGYFIAKRTHIPDSEIYAFWLAFITGIPYLLIKTNSKKYKIN